MDDETSDDQCLRLGSNQDHLQVSMEQVVASYAVVGRMLGMK